MLCITSVLHGVGPAIFTKVYSVPLHDDVRRSSATLWYDREVSDPEGSAMIIRLRSRDGLERIEVDDAGSIKGGEKEMHRKRKEG